MKEEASVRKIAALFVDEDGPYSKDDRFDAWGISRDAMNYSGSMPVIAHPPCQLWGSLAYVNYARWGGDHNKPGNDEGKFKFALDTVRRCGGVLEHPAKTRAFERYGIKKPSTIGWMQVSESEWVCEVWQSAYGHKANKATWLFYSGTTHPKELDWSRPIGSHQIGQHDQRGKLANKPTVTRKEATLTPWRFKEELYFLALNCSVK